MSSANLPTDTLQATPPAEQPAARKRGRPLSFDRAVALEQAMLTFWQHGFEATSIQDLTKAMHITAPSLYAAFGDKQQLFLECIDWYERTDPEPTAVIFAQAATARAAIERWLNIAALKLTQPNKPNGCMLVTAATNCTAQSSCLQDVLTTKRNNTSQLIQARLRQGQQDGDVSADIDIKQLADFYNTVVHGLTIQALDGANRTTLQAIVNQAMKAWD